MIYSESLGGAAPSVPPTGHAPARAFVRAPFLRPGRVIMVNGDSTKVEGSPDVIDIVMDPIYD